MASRVNTRFVVLLVVGVIGLLGMVMLAYNVAFKSASDLAAEGDRLLAAGEIKMATRAYSKAVNKDTTNVVYLNKWIDTLELLVPETETEYRDQFFGDYTGAIRQAATVLRNDVETHDRFLNLRFRIFMSEYSRAGAEQLIELTTSALANFSGGTGDVADWERLKRYRGIAITEIARRNGVLADGQMELAIDDLERAVAANPEDVQSRIKLMNLRTLQIDRTTAAGLNEPRVASLSSSLAEAEEYLASHPTNAMMRIQRILLKAEIASRSPDSSLNAEQQRERFIETYSALAEELTPIAASLTSDASDQLDLETVQLFGLVENALVPQAQHDRTRRLLDHLLDRNRDNAELLYTSGRLARDASEFEEAIGLFKRIATLEVKPLSFEGLRQFNIQRQALIEQSEIKIDQAINASAQGDESLKLTLLNDARALRESFASSVSEDSLSLVLLDGKIAQAEQRFEEALRLFKKYNEQTQRNSPEGLWHEGIIASQLGQYGVARDALEQMIPLDNSNRKLLGLLALAQIHERLQDYETAADYYEELLRVNPGLQVAIDGLENVNKLLFPELNEDPVIAAIYTARRMRLGTEENPGDYAGAVELLREAVTEHDYDPRVAQELASLLLDSNDVEGARTLIATAAEKHPENETLKSMLSALESGSSDEILIQMIRESDRPELEKLLAVANLATSRGMADLFAETVAELNKLAPNDKRVIEMSFLDALRAQNLELARTLAQRPELTQVESLTFRARLASAENKPNDAIELLKQATATGTADAASYQMLAILQRETGRMNDALASFEQALAIRPDNQDVIREYLVTLVRAGQFEQALSTARRLQRYGANDPGFMNIWLNLESQFGGTQGRSFAVRQRERMLELNPSDLDNTFQLARMYIQARNWDASRLLIDRLRASGDQLDFVQLDATWNAEQGNVNGRNGLVAANEVFSKYIDSLPSPVGPEPYIVNSEFMLERGRPDLALAAANEAVKRESPETMIGSKLLGDLNMRINNFSDAVKAYQAVIDAGADDENFTVRARLIETLVRLERYQEAQSIYDQFPASKKLEMITMLQGADIASGVGDSAKARNILDQAVSAYPNEPLVYIKRAELMIGDETLLNDMLSDLSRAIDLDVNGWRAYRVRAAGYFATGRREDALNDLKTTIRLNPSLDRSIYAVLNELLVQPNRAGEAADFARDVLSRRPDDPNLMSRIGGLFASRDLWEYASEFYGMAWDKRRGIGDGATYIDTLVRQRPPNANKANEVINALAAMVGDINTNSGLLAAQALVLQARGRDDFAQQQITKAFDIAVNNDSELINWANNLSRYFEERPASEHVGYLDILKRRTNDPEVGLWLDYFIAQRLVREDPRPQRADDILARLKSSSIPDPIAIRVYRLHGTTLFAEDQYEQAAAVWSEGLDRFSDDWEMNNNLAYVLSSRLDRAQDALAYGEKAIAKNIGLSEPYETMAGIYIALGKYDEAQQMIDTGSNFINSIPARVTMQLTAGRLAVKLGNLTDARSKITDARSVLRSAPESFPSLEQDIAAFEQELNSGEN